MERGGLLRLPRPKRRKEDLKDLYTGVGEGERNVACARLAGSILRAGVSQDDCLQLLLCWNERNDPKMDEGEVHDVVRSIHGREVEQRGRRKPRSKRDIKRMMKKKISR